MTPKEFATHMASWAWRRDEKIQDSHRLAYNIAALVGKAMSGKLKKFENEFPKKQIPSKVEKEKLQKDFKAFSQFLQKEREKKSAGKPG